MSINSIQQTQSITRKKTIKTILPSIYENNIHLRRKTSINETTASKSKVPSIQQLNLKSNSEIKQIDAFKNDGTCEYPEYEKYFIELQKYYLVKSNENFKKLIKPYNYYLNDSIFKCLRITNDDQSIIDYESDDDFSRYAPTDDEDE